mgnify:CR=1 FL=1
MDTESDVKLDLNIVLDLNKIFEDNSKFDKVSSKLAWVVVSAIDEGVEELGKRAEKKCKELMSGYGLGNSSLYNNLTVEKMENGFYISTFGSNYSGEDYAMYVEFGTGIVGKEGKVHPKSGESGWNYDVNEHGESGWTYPTSADDPNPNKWQDEDGMYWAWTRGQQARPFMYETWLYLSRTGLRTVNGYINRALKKWGDELM